MNAWYLKALLTVSLVTEDGGLRHFRYNTKANSPRKNVPPTEENTTSSVLEVGDDAVVAGIETSMRVKPI